MNRWRWVRLRRVVHGMPKIAQELRRFQCEEPFVVVWQEGLPSTGMALGGGRQIDTMGVY